MQVEQAVGRDPRAVIPMGSIEQHGFLSLAVDAILAERVACEAAEPLGVPVFPPLNYGITPYFAKYPGSVSLRLDTYQRIVRDVLGSLAGSGFTRSSTCIQFISAIFMGSAAMLLQRSSASRLTAYSPFSSSAVLSDGEISGACPSYPHCSRQCGRGVQDGVQRATAV